MGHTKIEGKCQSTPRLDYQSVFLESAAKSLQMLNKHRNGCVNHLNSTKHLTVPTDELLETTANREIHKGVKPHKLATQILLLLHTGGMYYAQHCL